MKFPDKLKYLSAEVAGPTLHKGQLATEEEKRL
jgi:hypothetical protein